MKNIDIPTTVTTEDEAEQFLMHLFEEFLEQNKPETEDDYEWADDFNITASWKYDEWYVTFTPKYTRYECWCYEGHEFSIELN